MTRPSRRRGEPTPRDHLRRRRLAALRAAGVAALVLVAAGALLAAPHELAGVRLGGVAVGWWAAAAGAAGLLASLALGPR